MKQATRWLAAVLVAAVGCDSPQEIQCGEGTHLEDGFCVPNGDGGTDGTDGTDGGGDVADVPSDEGGETAPPWGARMHGIVWGPNRTFPVPGAMVVAYTTRPDDIPESPYCEVCVQPPSGVSYAISGPDGSFTLEVFTDRDFYLTTQKGQFRRIREWHSPAAVGEADLDQELTTLPSRKDQVNGDMIPNIALAVGDYDHIEDVLGKAGIGDVDSSNLFVWGSESGVFDIYDNGGDEDVHGAPIGDLINNDTQLSNYHVVFFPCSYNAKFEYMAREPVRTRIREWVRDGGKLYVSDYAYPVMEWIWPDFVDFTDGMYGDCADINASDPVDTCNHGPPFDAPSWGMDQGLSEWLFAVDDAVTGSWPVAEFETRENWDTIGGLAESYVGDDFDFAPVYQLPKVWVEGTWNYAPDDDPPTDWDYTTHHPFTISFPYGCGRVLYTTYHTVGGTTASSSAHEGFLTQEMVLWYLIMQIQVCQDEILL